MLIECLIFRCILCNLNVWVLLQLDNVSTILTNLLRFFCLILCSVTDSDNVLILNVRLLISQLYSLPNAMLYSRAWLLMYINKISLSGSRSIEQCQCAEVDNIHVAKV